VTICDSGEKGHKCRECPLWEKTKEKRRARRIVKERAARVARPQKAQQERWLARPTREEAQEGEKKLRRVEESEAARVAKLREVQQEWKRSSVEELRNRAEEHCGKGISEEAHLLELG